MIVKGKFENIFGIKNMEINFKQKYSKDKEQEDQIIKGSNNLNASLIPMILAKNATGKTSLIKAIDFALRFSNKETFIKYVSKLKQTIFLREMFQAIKDTDEFSFKETDMTKIICSELFKEVSFAGSEYFLIELETIYNSTIRLEGGKDFLTIFINKEKIDIFNFIDEIVLNDKDKESRVQANNTISKIVKEKAKKIKFISEHKNFSSLFRDTRPITEMNEINVKYKTKKHIETIIDKLGFNAFNFLLKKLDNNISSISFDIESKAFDIFLKNSDTPIAPKNLSFGTQKVLEILNNSLPLFENGGLMMIDEIENGLHLSLIKLIVGIFEDPEINKAKAQLLLTTHLPLLGEEEIINIWNIFIQRENSFVQLREFASRTYDQEKMIKNKNYYNDFFWLRNDTENKSSLSHLSINQIIAEFHEGVKFGKQN